MKYIVAISIVLSITAVALAGYFGLAKRIDSPAIVPASGETTADEITPLKSEIAKLQTELASQSVLIEKLKADNQTDIARIVAVEKKLQDAVTIIQALLLENKNASAAGSSQTDTGGADKPVISTGQLFSDEVFNDPQFTEVFQQKVEQAIKNIQQKEREEQTARFNQQMQERLIRRIDDFAKSANLSDYQKQELTRILSDTSAKALDLVGQMRADKISREEFTAQRDALRVEADGQAKGILLPQQYEQFQKSEQGFFRGGMMMGGGGREGGGGPPRQNRTEPAQPQ